MNNRNFARLIISGLAAIVFSAPASAAVTVLGNGVSQSCYAVSYTHLWGFLTGNRRRQDKGETTRAKSDDFAHGMYYADSDFDVVERVTEIAQKRGVPNAQVALAWLMQQRGVTAPIVGASKASHLQDAIAATSLKLDDVELKALAEPYKPHAVLGHR